MNKYAIMLLFCFFLGIATVVSGYEMVAEDYAVNVLTAYGETATEVYCRLLDNGNSLCVVKAESGKVYNVLCSKTFVEGNNKYSCTIMH